VDDRSGRGAGDVGDGWGLPGPHGWITPSDNNTMSTIPSAIR
jgi:hypothetical protein